jgi:hypothetical protein
VIDASFGDGFAHEVTATRTVIGGVPQVEVRVSAALPLVGWLGPRTMRVAGHALDEG